MGTNEAKVPSSELDSKEFSRRGEEIYDRKYREDFEREHRGKIVAISLETERAYLGEDTTDAWELGQESEPGTQFYFIRVGYSYVEKISSPRALGWKKICK